MTSPADFIDYVDTTVVPLPRTITSASPAVSGQLVTGCGLIIAISNRETSGSAPAACSLWDGTSIGGERLATLGLLANSSQPLSPASPGIPFRAGIFLEIRSGSCVVVVTYIPYRRGFPAAGPSA